MGCGSSSQFNDNHLSIKEEKHGKNSEMSIEDARRRREANAKERARRASVMAILEAEKLKQRKLSNASINNFQTTCETSGTDDEMVNKKKNEEVASSLQQQKGIVSQDDVPSNECFSNSNGRNKIQIIISPNSRTNSFEDMDT